jgi:hypothetical protein
MLPGNLLVTVVRQCQEALGIGIICQRWRRRDVASCPPVPLDRGKTALVYLFPGTARA